ncbi:threonine--tRNA ligase [Candidatus Woesearchaeota archaeon]|nr:threonine--tRNA ligase [Candidatus Woesearchaeota archaeon]
MSSMITITLPDGSTKEVKKGMLGREFAALIGKRLAEAALIIKVNGKMQDLFLPLEHDAKIEIITFDRTEGKEVFWHSSAHLLAQAIVKLWSDVKLTIGPAIETGFYYDFEKKEPFTPDDLSKIEAEMQKIAAADYKVSRKEVSIAEAKKIYAKNHFKLELLDEFAKAGETKVSIYTQGDFSDLCRGPHLPSTGKIKAFKLTKVSSAYWRGDQSKQSLQRIYGVSYPDAKMLKQYLEQQELAEQRNHKKLGEELELFAQFEMIGKGLPVWLPKGEVMRQEIENFAMDMEKKGGYVRVSTPHLAKKELFLTSGHLPYYEESMYPKMTLDDGDYYLKAMNCPMHHLIFRMKQRSYRELPLRLAEYGTCYRKELSGTLNGLLRVRSMRMNDAHIYCTKEQIYDEIEAVLSLIKGYFETFGLKDYWFRLSLGERSNKEKYIDEPHSWDHAEEVLRDVLLKLKLKFVEAANEAAFYGPKIDVQFKNVFGREETMSTVQLDFAAKKRFGLFYVDDHGKQNPDVYVIHRAPLSTHERFMAFLIEHFGGRFPFWLSPVQVALLTVADRHIDYAEDVKKALAAVDIRVETDYKANTIPKKVMDAEKMHIPVIVTIGDKEMEAKTLAVRIGNNVEFGVKAHELVERLKKVKDERKLVL